MNFYQLHQLQFLPISYHFYQLQFLTIFTITITFAKFEPDRPRIMLTMTKNNRGGHV